jgi:hypothetical protein
MPLNNCYYSTCKLAKAYKYLLLLVTFLFVSLNVSIAQNCPVNIDFELGNFQNWQCYIGSTSSNGIVNTISVLSSIATANRHVIIPKGTLKDPICGFPISAPNGSGYSIQLGNSGTGSQAERVTYTFNVPANQQNFVITYQYAIVLNDGGHNADQ